MQSHEQWLRIAREDLLAAKALLKLDLLGSVAYHAQQCAEKSLKGYLALKKVEIMKTHDLVKLVVLCTKFDDRFEKLREAAAILNPFSSKFRYPIEHEIPDYNGSELAIKEAQTIFNFVIKKINEPVTGQTEIFTEV